MKGDGMTKRTEIALVPIEWDAVDLVEQLPDLRLVGFFDPDASADTGELPCLGNDEDWPKVKSQRPDLKIALLLDPPALRARMFAHYGEESIISVISPDAHISHRSSFGAGFIAQRGVVVMPLCRIGKGCALNVGAALHHECQLGDFVTVAPGARLLGTVRVGDGAYIGAGATILQNLTIGAGAFIGAGAMVIRDVPDGATVVGVPADRRLR